MTVWRARQSADAASRPDGLGVGGRGARPKLLSNVRSLSVSLLVLTVLFIMLCEVFVYAPSIARFRLTYLKNAITDSHLAVLALEAAPGQSVSPNFIRKLLHQAQAHVVVRRSPNGSKRMLIAEMPPTVSATYDLRAPSFFGLIFDAFVALAHPRDRVLRVIDYVPGDRSALMEILIDEAPLRRDMFDYSWRILFLSLVISFFTATLVYLSLHWLLIIPMRRLTQNMIDFSRDPEDAKRVMVPTGRGDELGVAQQELANMQANLRAALRQNARLATLGAAVTKINHDLRNMLATAQLVSDRLASSDDPQVKRIAPTMLRAIDRAVRLCTQTLDFARSDTEKLKVDRFLLSELVAEVFAVEASAADDCELDNQVEPLLSVAADRGQIFRVVSNLVRNSLLAGATRVSVSAHRNGGIGIDITDNGPGIPEAVRGALFEPFHASGSKGGTGLGLAIAREIVETHGGAIELVATGPNGTQFRFRLPEG